MSAIFDGGPKVQLSLDLQTLDVALPTAEIAVRAGVDWLEVGTPLRIVHRIKDVDKARGYPRYFWKATPLQA